MQFDFLSDIHLEAFSETNLEALGTSFDDYWRCVFDTGSSDTLLLAGDVTDDFASGSPAADRFFELACARWKHIVCVLGNHDYWSATTPFTLTAGCIRRRYPQIVLLDGSVTEIGGTVIWGSTFWSHIPAKAQPAVARLMPDYSMTRSDPPAVFTPAYTSECHRRALDAIDRALRASEGKPFVVLTHHAPSFRSTSWPRTELSDAFCSADDKFLETHPGIRIWIHGHLHEPSRYRIGDAVVLCNPHGYLLTERLPGEPFRCGSIAV